MLYFRSKKYQSDINCSFFVKDGPNIDDLNGFMIGDTVTIMIDVTEEIENAIEENLPEHSGVRMFSDLRKKYIVMPFNVVDRRHALSYKSTGTLQTLGVSIYLEAKSGYWEDIFMCLLCDKQPEWLSTTGHGAA